MKKILSNGDCLRLLPIPKKDGSLITSLSLTYCYIKEHNRILYDNTGLMNKIWRMMWRSLEGQLRQLGLDSLNIGSRTWFYTESNGEVKYIEVGRKLTNIIEGYNFSYDSDDYLLVDIK